MSAHFFKRAGSVCGRFAFCANFVFGRLIVFFRSSVASSVAISDKYQNRNSNRTNQVSTTRVSGWVKARPVHLTHPLTRIVLTIVRLQEKTRTIFSGD